MRARILKESEINEIVVRNYRKSFADAFNKTIKTINKDKTCISEFFNLMFDENGILKSDAPSLLEKKLNPDPRFECSKYAGAVAAILSRYGSVCSYIGYDFPKNEIGTNPPVHVWTTLEKYPKIIFHHHNTGNVTYSVEMAKINKNEKSIDFAIFKLNSRDW